MTARGTKWDTLLTDINVATLRPGGAPYGAIENAAIAIANGEHRLDRAAIRIAGDFRERDPVARRLAGPRRR